MINHTSRKPPTFTLNNGVTLPVLGLGVFQSAPEETAAAVETALATGYRHVDTAAGYGNEREVGEGVRHSGLGRDEVFLETKVWVSDYGYEETLHAFDKSATKLGVEQIDLLILHQPMPQHFDRTRQAYRALEHLLTEGRVRAIGVSNFMPHHLTALLEQAEVVPAVNQVELHPYFTQPDVQTANARHGVLTQAWSPIGGITTYPGWGENRASALADPTIAGIAEAHDKSPAQVMLRWHLQQGRSAIPKSTRSSRIAENFAVLDFALDATEVARLDALDTGWRGGPDPDAVDPSTWDLSIPEA
ncbi:aldo/keto reductase [Kineococcus sp. GCM10028916]|uniref:aldo/keto reductase n=1 Tax=Kineococcus sp. GCM10028916 TaxID=3273394 RepID=UPI0036452C21